MLTLVLLLIFLVVLGLSWFQGLWNNLLTLINVLFAAMIAVSFYEPIATAIAQRTSLRIAGITSAWWLWRSRMANARTCCGHRQRRTGRGR